MDLDEWLAALSVAIGTSDLPFDHADRRTLLEVARDSAHNVERVAAPLTTYLVGVAVGRGGSLESVAGTASALAAGAAASPSPPPISSAPISSAPISSAPISSAPITSTPMAPGAPDPQERPD